MITTRVSSLCWCREAQEWRLDRRVDSARTPVSSLFLSLLQILSIKQFQRPCDWSISETPMRGGRFYLPSSFWALGCVVRPFLLLFLPPVAPNLTLSQVIESGRKLGDWLWGTRVWESHLPNTPYPYTILCPCDSMSSAPEPFATRQLRPDICAPSSAAKTSAPHIKIQMCRVYEVRSTISILNVSI